MSIVQVLINGHSQALALRNSGLGDTFRSTKLATGLGLRERRIKNHLNTLSNSTSVISQIVNLSVSLHSGDDIHTSNV